jgi:hypothetical protein
MYNGAKGSPSVCDIRLHSNLSKSHLITYHVRYHNDGFIIFHGEENEIHDLTIENFNHQLLKFTYKSSGNDIHFLHININRQCKLIRYYFDAPDVHFN